MKTTFQTNELTKIALFSALISVSAYIAIPLPFSPVSLTAQTFIINLMALLSHPVRLSAPFFSIFCLA